MRLSGMENNPESTSLHLSERQGRRPDVLLPNPHFDNHSAINFHHRGSTGKYKFHICLACPAQVGTSDGDPSSRRLCTLCDTERSFLSLEKAFCTDSERKSTETHLSLQHTLSASPFMEYMLWPIQEFLTVSRRFRIH